MWVFAILMKSRGAFSGVILQILLVSHCKIKPWKFQFYFNEIRELSSSINVNFCHEVRSANFMADALAKQGVKRVIPWLGVIM